MTFRSELEPEAMHEPLTDGACVEYRGVRFCVQRRHRRAYVLVPVPPCPLMQQSLYIRDQTACQLLAAGKLVVIPR